MRIFALEYIRKMINEYEVHFVHANKISQFMIKSQIGPFICNNRVAGEEEGRILKDMKFTHSFTWSYDPMGIISKKRVENKSTPYIHTQRLEIEKYMNQEEWATNTLQEVKEQVTSTLGIQTPTPQERKVAGEKDDKGKEPEKDTGRKRTRDDQIDMDIDTSTKEFKMKYRKRSKFHMDIDQDSEKDQQTVITI